MCRICFKLTRRISLKLYQRSGMLICGTSYTTLSLIMSYCIRTFDYCMIRYKITDFEINNDILISGG